MDNFKEQVLKYVGIELSDLQLSQFKKLADTLIETNKITNLTAIRDEEGVYTKHFLDSLTLLKAIPKEAGNLADIGSGAGFPGLPIAIARPDLKITMVESIGKKTFFIDKCIDVLKLQNARVFQIRAETLVQDKKYAKSFDIVTARAVAFLPKLLELCIPLMNPKGIFIAMKNDNNDELIESEKALYLLGVKIDKKIHIDIPTLTPRQLIVISKNNIQ